MKKFILTSVLGLSFLLTSTSAFAASVGIVDTKKIFESSKLFEELNKAKSEMGGLEESIKKETFNKSKLLDDARAKNAKEDELIPVDHSIAIFEVYEGEKSLVICEGTHNSGRQKHILEKIGKFFSKYLLNMK